MEHAPPGDEHIAAQAADWFLQFQDRSQNERVDSVAFAEWLTRSPAHVQEFLEVATLWSTLGTTRSSEYVVEDLVAAARAEQAKRKVVQLPATRVDTVPGFARTARTRRPAFYVALAASLLIVLVLGASLVLSRRGTEFVTAVGEQRSVTLSDGSVLFLNTNSAAGVRFRADHREIDLIRGEARFQVARSAQRPFVVVTTDATIHALGTVFNVAMDQEGTRVAVIEGRVELRERGAGDVRPVMKPGGRASPDMGATVPKTKHAPLELAAGQRAQVTSRGIEPDVGPSIESVNAWTAHRLVFRDKTLAEVVREFNRYRPRRLVVDDPELAALRISGTFDPSDPDSLLAYLGTEEAVQASTPADGNIHLSRGR